MGIAAGLLALQPGTGFGQSDNIIQSQRAVAGPRATAHPDLSRKLRPDQLQRLKDFVHKNTHLPGPKLPGSGN